MDIHDLDLNLLVVFDVLLRERRVAAAARELGISQPGVSNALNRMRRVFSDELFLRTSNGMVPTPLAESLAEPVSDALGRIRAMLNKPNGFDPAQSARSFTIAMTDIGEIYFLPQLMKWLSATAPGVTVSTVRDTAINLREEMETGRVDLALGFLPDLQAGFFQQRLFRQRYVCLYRRGHPAAGADGLTLKAFRAAEHISVVAAGTGHGLVDEMIQRAGVTRNVRMRVPHFVAVGHIVQQTDLIAVVPEAYAMRTLEPFGLACAPCPVKIPDIVINMLWHGKNHRDTGNRWLREHLFEEFSR